MIYKALIYTALSISLISLMSLGATPESPEYVDFFLNKNPYLLTYKMTPRPWEPSDSSPENLAYEASLQSNAYFEDQNWVQIVRQDDFWNPTKGIGIGFSLHDELDSLPYRPDRVAMQFKDFLYGGQHFSQKDTANFSGIFNDINGDLKLEITEFENDTISGTFSGVLLSGSGKMAHLESGKFRIGLHRR